MFGFNKSHTGSGQRIDWELSTESCPTHSRRVKSEKEGAGTQTENLAWVSRFENVSGRPFGASQKSLIPGAFLVGGSGLEIEKMLSLSFPGYPAATDAGSAL